MESIVDPVGLSKSKSKVNEFSTSVFQQFSELLVGWDFQLFACLRSILRRNRHQLCETRVSQNPNRAKHLDE